MTTNIKTVMKTFLFILSFAIMIQACKKTADNPDSEKAWADTEEAGTATRRLLYSDSIFYRPVSGNLIVRPVSRPRGTGYYKCIPSGLALDSATGRVNVKLSQSGIRYKIYYVSFAGIKRDSTKMIISGIDYMDGIYTLANGQDTAFPSYNANPGAALPCTDDDEEEEDDDDGCEFDETDLDDDGDDDVTGVDDDKLFVSKRLGTIDLEASLDSGLLGANPTNGATGDFLFYYRLADLSNKALQSIKVRVYFYQTVADIPQALLDTINFRNQQYQQVNNLFQAGGIIGTASMSVASAGSDTITADQQHIATYARPKRPPVIIITRQ